MEAGRRDLAEEFIQQSLMEDIKGSLTSTPSSKCFHSFMTLTPFTVTLTARSQLPGPSSLWPLKRAFFPLSHGKSMLGNLLQTNTLEDLLYYSCWSSCSTHWKTSTLHASESRIADGAMFIVSPCRFFRRGIKTLVGLTLSSNILLSSAFLTPSDLTLFFLTTSLLFHSTPVHPRGCLSAPQMVIRPLWTF